MAFISEIHYKNTVASSTGVSEYVEVTVSPAEMARLADFQIATYQTDGTIRTILNLTDYTPTIDPNTGWYVFQMATLVTDPNHTTGTNEAEAVAFMDYGQSPALQTFVDIGGGTTNITAVSGPAAGATSTNIPAASGQTIQWDVHGTRIDGNMTQGSSIVCLTHGTLIRTPRGPRLIETLAPGDLVDTLDHGPQPLLMKHERHLSPAELLRDAELWPVRIAAGSIDGLVPGRDLLVSPQHRILCSQSRFDLFFGAPEAFVRAKAMAQAPNMRADRVFPGAGGVTYVHLVFARHEVIFAEDTPTESFHPGPEALAVLAPEEREELFKLFPDLAAGIARDEANFVTLRAWEYLAAVA